MPERVVAEEGFERWHGRGALGYLTLATICDGQIADPPGCSGTGRAGWRTPVSSRP